MNRVFVGKKMYACKGTFDELNQNEFVQIAQAMSLDGAWATVYALRLLLGLQKIQNWVLAWKIRFLNDNQLSELMRLTAFLTELEISKNHFFGYKDFQTPEKLTGFTFGHFIAMDSYFLAFQKTKQTSYMDNMITVFLGQAEIDEKTLKKVQKLSSKIKKAIFISFLALRQKIVKTYPKVFQASTEKNQAQNWGQVLRKVAGNVVQMQAVADLPVMEVFFDISESIKDYEEQVRQMEAQKR